MKIIRRERIGQYLIERWALTPEQLEIALDYQKKTGDPLGETLAKLGFLPKESFLSLLAEQLGVPFHDLQDAPPDPDAVRLLPAQAASRFQVIPIRRRGQRLILGMKDPTDVEAQEEIRLLTGLTVEPVLVDELELQRLLEGHVGVREQAELALRGIRKPPAAPQEAQQAPAEPETPLVGLVNTIIHQAIREGASDIHIEPTADHVRIRLRVDGLLREGPTPPRHLHESIISRIKVMAGMDIAERRLPQDGRIPYHFGGRDYDLRISTMPSLHGEKAVVRILDKSKGIPLLEALGMSEVVFQRYTQLLARPYGIILVTGPTGSGKSTTLAATLQRLNAVERNIVTVEDPIEYEIPGATQTQVNVKAGLTFGLALRHLLRQDPDVIMIGEIRDAETAHIAVRAALTGHLVLSTLHTNDAPSAVARLVDMGVEPFLLAPALLGVLAQRLVRVLCPQCRTPYEPAPEILPPGSGSRGVGPCTAPSAAAPAASATGAARASSSCSPWTRGCPPS